MEDILKNQIRAWLSRPMKPNASIDLPEISGAVGSSIGEVRKENQDRAVIARLSPVSTGRRPFVLAVLCDGMGGMEDGAKCAELAIATLLSRVAYSPRMDLRLSLKNAVDEANRNVHLEFRARGGTTLVAVLITATDIVAVSVGDSRLYVRTPADCLKQISVDDTIAGELSRIKGGTSSTEDLEPFSKQLAQFVGMGEDMEPRIYPLDDPGAGAYFILSSDGAHSSQPGILESILVHSPSPHVGLGRLIHLANWCGGGDNASVICISTAARASLTIPPKPTAILELWDSQSKVEFVLSTTVANTIQPPTPSPPAVLSTPGVPKIDKRRSAKPRASSPKGAKGKPGPKQRTLEIEVGRAKLEAPKIIANPSPEGHPDPGPKPPPAGSNSPEES